MKNTLKKFIAIMVVLAALSPLRTFAAVNVYADDIQTNDTAAISEAPAVTNAPAAKPSRDKKLSSDADHPDVRIDHTGIHVGGPDPVDIEAPVFARHGVERATDMVPIVAIVSTFGMPVAIVAIALYFKHRRNKMTHETLRAMVDKGVPVTPELVAQLRSRNSAGCGDGRSRGALLPGLVLAGIGTALLISDHGRSTGGWIVLFIGVAFLILWSVERKNQNNVQPPR